MCRAVIHQPVLIAAVGVTWYLPPIPPDTLAPLQNSSCMSVTFNPSPAPPNSSNVSTCTHGSKKKNAQLLLILSWCVRTLIPGSCVVHRNWMWVSLRPHMRACLGMSVHAKLVYRAHCLTARVWETITELASHCRLHTTNNPHVEASHTHMHRTSLYIHFTFVHAIISL